jgi:hypothetical protein
LCFITWPHCAESDWSTLRPACLALSVRARPLQSTPCLTCLASPSHTSPIRPHQSSPFLACLVLLNLANLHSSDPCQSLPASPNQATHRPTTPSVTLPRLPCISCPGFTSPYVAPTNPSLPATPIHACHLLASQNERLRTLTCLTGSLPSSPAFPRLASPFTSAPLRDLPCIASLDLPLRSGPNCTPPCCSMTNLASQTSPFRSRLLRSYLDLPCPAMFFQSPPDRACPGQLRLVSLNRTLMSRTYRSTPALPFRTSPCRPCHPPLRTSTPSLTCLVMPSLAPPDRALPGPSWPHFACLVSPCIFQPRHAQQRLSRLDPACRALPSLALTCLFLAPLHPSRPALIFPPRD